MKSFFLAPAAGALLLVASVPAEAQWNRPDARPSYGYSPYAEARRIAYDNGYREGVKEGEKDGRQHDRYEYRDERDFQRADAGYHNHYGDVERYRQSFRAGFIDGYGQGFGRYSRGNGHGYGGYRGGYGYYSPAFDNGAREGFEKGVDDARDHDRYDPRAQKWYREGDRHYKDDYGPREQYKDDYRRGFLSGYEQGYRTYR